MKGQHGPNATTKSETGVLEEEAVSACCPLGSEGEVYVCPHVL